MVTPRYIFTRLRESSVIYVFFAISLILLIFSNAESNVCGHCISFVADSSVPEQTNSNFVIAEKELESTVHSHGDHDSGHHGEQTAQCGCEEKSQGLCAVTDEEPSSQKKTCQDADAKHQQCDCNSSEDPFPASCERFQSTPPKREYVSAKSFPMCPGTSCVLSTDLEVKLDLASLRCHSPTTLSNRPIDISGLGTQHLIC